MIQVTDLHKTFHTKTGKVAAVAGVGFAAHDGEITGLLVPTAGTWTIAVTALIDDFDKIVLDGPVVVQP